MNRSPFIQAGSITRNRVNHKDDVCEIKAYDVLIGYTYGATFVLNGELSYAFGRDEDMHDVVREAYARYAHFIANRDTFITHLRQAADYSTNHEGLRRLCVQQKLAVTHIKHMQGVAYEMTGERHAV